MATKQAEKTYRAYTKKFTKQIMTNKIHVYGLEVYEHKVLRALMFSADEFDLEYQAYDPYVALLKKFGLLEGLVTYEEARDYLVYELNDMLTELYDYVFISTTKLEDE